MARALSNYSLRAALSDGVALLASRRGHSTAAATVAGAGRRERLAVAEQMVKRAAAPPAAEAEECSWVPDPATGYYRPANRMGEIDPAELREMLLRRDK